MKFMTLSAPSRLLAILFLLASLSACQTTKEFFGMDGTKKQPETETLELEPLYALGVKELEGQNYDTAERTFIRLVARFPYGELSEKAQINLAYTQYKLSKPEEATSTISRFTAAGWFTRNRFSPLNCTEPIGMPPSERPC